MSLLIVSTSCLRSVRVLIVATTRLSVEWSASPARPSMRPPVDDQRIRALARELGRVARGSVRIYRIGGSTAVLEGWREATIDVDLRFEPEARLERLRNAPAYREREHDILIVDTAALLSSHVEEVTLSPMNSGATHAGAKYTRGSETFKPINSYPWDVSPQEEPERASRRASRSLRRSRHRNLRHVSRVSIGSNHRRCYLSFDWIVGYDWVEGSSIIRVSGSRGDSMKP
jgi:hypothetical protein